MITKEFISKARSVHADTYSYRQTVYENSKTRVIIECSIHGPFEQFPGPHLEGAGCKRCGDVARGEASALKATETFLEKARKVHGNRYDLSTTHYVRSGEKITVTFHKHGIFSIRPNNFLRGIGCSKCGDESMAAKQSTGKDKFVKQAQKVHADRFDYSAVSYV